MSLDVFLIGKKTVTTEPQIFVRENGSTKAISREDWNSRFPDKAPVMMCSYETNEIYSSNITHNLVQMAIEASIYKYLWRPEELGISTAGQLIDPLTEGLRRLKNDPDLYKKHNPPNGWGNYENLVTFIEKYLEACKENPDAEVRVSR